MERDQDSAPFEWVNDWAAASKPSQPGTPEAATIATEIPVVQAPVIHAAPAIPTDQLMRDIAEIERTRDALAAVAVPVYGKRTQAIALVPSRTSDPVPVVIGGVLALVMLTLFGAAAAMTKLAR